MRAKNAGDQRENRPDRLMEALRSRELDGGSDFIEEVSREQAARAPHLFMPGPMLRSPGLHLRSPSLLLLFFSPGPGPAAHAVTGPPRCVQPPAACLSRGTTSDRRVLLRIVWLADPQLRVRTLASPLLYGRSHPLRKNSAWCCTQRR